VPRRYSQVKGRTPTKFAFLTTYSQFNGRSPALNFQQKCSHFKRQSDTRDLLEIAERIKDAGAGLRSIAEPWADTTTPAGRMVLTVFAGIADFERSLIVERTSAGRLAAKARGIRFGPHPSLGAEQIAHARQLIQQAGKPVAEVAKLLGRTLPLFRRKPLIRL
jgi:DNA invertase Pin-like site-specific DNA recombinase